ncbi:MAG: glycosyltransferase [Bradyrhizobium sp.]|uniref:glycosyltransferase family 2 protein n=1 Tax=Bradyrhizobium sp. TaxID=376 RepID=UPI001D5D3883|nr:glycosyltransferase [Bradyrhizobium sp.]MBV9561733.1 glycosyltransferase [Bradyrhizobium sp.]
MSDLIAPTEQAAEASTQLIVAVGIATAGRREILTQTLATLTRQRRLPDLLVVCPVAPENDVDAAALANLPFRSKVVTGPAGLPAQRNAILAACADADVVVFFDDDFFPEGGYLAELEKLLVENEKVICVTGFLIADGAKGPGISVADGLRMIAAPTRTANAACEIYGAYGCNMAFRLEAIRRHDIRFDEKLPLYGWQEDIDFSRRVAPFGQIVKARQLQGVHLGTKRGRTSGVRLGYSQIANPIYLIRKGSLSWKHAKMLMWRNLAANFARSIYPEPWIDRRGRLKGNLLALRDLVVGHLSPDRIMNLR